MQDRISAQIASDQYYAAVDVAGQVFAALLYEANIAQVEIIPFEDASWEGCLTYSNSPSAERMVRVAMAGEAALVLCHLQDEQPVQVWGKHHGLADQLRQCPCYWAGFDKTAMLAGLMGEGDQDLKVQDSEIAALLLLFRCHMYRLMRQGNHRRAIEAIAKRLRAVKALSGAEAERIFREQGCDVSSRIARSTESEKTMNRQENESEGVEGQGVTGQDNKPDESEFFCPDLFDGFPRGNRMILRCTVEVPLEKLEWLNAWVREHVLELEPEICQDRREEDDLNEATRDLAGDAATDEDNDDREWLGYLGDSDNTTLIEIEVPGRRASVLDRLFAEHPEIVRVQVETAQLEEDEN